MLKLEHLAWSIPGGESIIKDIDLELGEGKLVVVTGPNGGGKTSLAKLIAGVETLSGGRIIFDGEDITDMDVRASWWWSPAPTAAARPAWPS